MTSAQRKFLRGVEQVKSLLDEVHDFTDGQCAYTFDTEFDRRSPNELGCRCFSTERQAPPDHWPLVAGEAIQNIRASLDHSIWAAWRGVKKNTGDGDHTQFVLCDHPADFKKARWRLKGVPEPVRTVVKNSQPYSRWAQDPSSDTIAILRRLSNLDKHRTLSVVASAVEHEWVGVASHVEIKDWHPATGKRLGKGKTEVSTFTAFSGDAEVNEMDVDPNFSYEVGIERMPLDILRVIVDVVFEVLHEVETGAPVNPFAPYPLPRR